MRGEHLPPEENLLNRLIRLCAIILVVAIATPAFAEKAPPFDQASRFPSLVKFRAELVGILRSRDMNRLQAMMREDPDERNDLAKAVLADPGLWDEFADILALGGGFYSNAGALAFQAPYPAEHDCIKPRGQGKYCNLGASDQQYLEAKRQGFVIGTNVKVHAEPDATSRVLAVLAYDIVIVNKWNWPQAISARPGWVEIELGPNKAKGFVAGANIRSAYDNRVTIAIEPTQLAGKDIGKPATIDGWKVYFTFRNELMPDEFKR